MPALKDERKVVTNIPLNVEWFCNFIGPHCKDLIVQIDGGFHNYGGQRYFSDADHFLRYQDWRNDKNQGVYFIVDECHLVMPRASRADGISTQQQLKEYLSMHRHYGHDLLLLSQNFRKVDRDIVDMIQTCYFTTKLSFLGKDDQYVCKVADGVTRNIVTTHHRDYEQKYFAAYQSHTKSEGSVQEAGTVDIPAWYQRWYNIGAIIMLVLFVLLMMKAFSSKEKSTEPINSPQQASTLPGKPPPPVVQTVPQVSQDKIPLDRVSQDKVPGETKNSDNHPYKGLQMHIVGNYQDFNNRGNYQKVIWITLSRNGQILSEITHADLALAGYDLRVLNDCLIDLHYGDFQNYVFCDSPTQSVTTPSIAQAASGKQPGG